MITMSLEEADKLVGQPLLHSESEYLRHMLASMCRQERLLQQLVDQTAPQPKATAPAVEPAKPKTTKTKKTRKRKTTKAGSSSS